jgi:Pyruvate/2-oxoacid:ferredoxin oxidoreductase delta subunit
MLIDQETCIGCEDCQPYCPVQAIRTIEGEDLSEIDQDECVECGVCLRAEVCPTDAIDLYARARMAP